MNNEGRGLVGDISDVASFVRINYKRERERIMLKIII